MISVKRKFLALIYYMVYGIIYFGWLFQRSVDPVFFNYSVTYLIFLAVMLIPFLFLFLLSIYERKVGRKGAVYTGIIAGGFLGALFFLGSIFYYHTRVHRFDPFLQNPPADIAGIPVKEKDEIRILCLGGSTTENAALAPDRRYPKVLERILKDRYGIRKARVINGGKNWFTTEHSLIAYVTYYSDLKPDIIVVMHSINDILRSFSPADYALGEYNDRWSHFYGPAINGARPPTFEKYLAAYLEVPMRGWYAPFRFKAVDFPVSRYVSIKSYERFLRKLSKCVRNDGAKIVFVAQPSIYKEQMSNEEMLRLNFGMLGARERSGFFTSTYPSHRSFLKAMEEFRRVERKVAVEEAAAYLDADAELPKKLDYFKDDVHYTEKGAELLASFIASEIVSDNLLKAAQVIK